MEMESSEAAVARGAREFIAWVFAALPSHETFVDKAIKTIRTAVFWQLAALQPAEQNLAAGYAPPPAQVRAD